jgi:glutathione S-transferase
MSVTRRYGREAKGSEIMSEIVVHGVPGSPYVRAVLMGLREKGADHRLAAMGFGDGKSPTHLARHPFGRIPVIDHGDFQLYETQAILRYIDRIAPFPALIPTDPRAEARMNQVIGISDSYVFPDISGCISFYRVFAPRFGMPVDEAKIADALPRAKICIDEVARLIGRNAFMAGNTLSLADLMIVPHLAYFSITEEGRAMMGPHAHLTGWLDRMKQRPSMMNTTAAKLMGGQGPEV